MTATIPVIYAAEMSGTDFVERKLQELNEVPRGLTGVMQEVGHSVKEVGKDLDNLGLKAGKDFAMAAEGAWSVVTALGAGGAAGVIGAVTVGVGFLAQAWANHNAEVANAKKAAEQLKLAEAERWKSSLAYLKEYREGQKEKSTQDLVDIARAREAEVIFLQATQNRVRAQMHMERLGSEERNRLAREVQDYTGKIAAAVEKRDVAMYEAGLARDLEEGNREQEKANREEARRRIRAERIAAWNKHELERRKKLLADFEALDVEVNRAEAERRARSLRESNDEIKLADARHDAATQAIRSAAAERYEIQHGVREAIRAEEADFVEWEISTGKRALEQRRGTTQLELAEYNQAAEQRRAAHERELVERRIAERENTARARVREEQQRELSGVEVDALNEQAALDRMLAEQRITNRQREADAAVASAHAQENAARNLLVANTALSVSAQSYATVLDNTLTPAIRGLSDATRVLGEINWETYDQYRITLKDIPPLMLQRAQAELFGMAISSAGAAAQKGAEAVGYASQGAAMTALGMPNANLMFAAAAGSAASAALHASFAASQGVAAVGAMGAGFALSSAGVAGFTQEDEERRRRDGGSSTGLPGLARLTGAGDGSNTGGGSTRGGGGSGTGAVNQTVILDYSNALVLDPDDQRRAQRVWNEVQAANQRDGWGSL